MRNLCGAVGQFRLLTLNILKCVNLSLSFFVKVSLLPAEQPEIRLCSREMSLGNRDLNPVSGTFKDS
jgi:hypothetical protein